MGYSTVLLIYFSQKSRRSILIISRNRDFAFRLIGGADRVLKIELLKKDDSRNLLQKKLSDDKSDEKD
jgi:hypothetical protein